MHAEAYEWVSRYRTDEPVSVLEIGSRDINGTCRPLFPNATYVGLDITSGKGVDIVADATTWKPDKRYDVVLATEVFEHTADWRTLLVTAFKALKPGGRLVATMAGPGRPPHSAVDGAQLRDGEYYANIDPDDLLSALEGAGFAGIAVDSRMDSHDVRAVATKVGPTVKETRP